ncbi:MAG: anti-sigma factor [Pseudomonadota bacterium]
MNDRHPEIEDLLLRRATEGLSGDEADRLKTLLDEHGFADTDDYELAAAAAANALALRASRDTEDAPAHLKDKLRADADRFFADSETDSKVVELPPRTRAFEPGWAVAAMLAVVLLASVLIDTGESLQSPADARFELLADAATETLPWAQPDDPRYAQVTGDVVWNDDRQEGYLRLAGMPVNDSAQSQYQLWVVDPDRDSNPVDGGVFDIPAGAGEVVVPITAKLAVDRPVAFAITREKPGGVVVSAGPLLVVASAG